MVKVEYYRKRHRVCVKGHAESGAAGHDLVCASVSVLVFTLASFVESMTDCKAMKAKCVKLDSGDSRISVSVDKAQDAAVMLAFDAICAGFAILSIDYPDFVSYEVFEH